MHGAEEARVPKIQMHGLEEAKVSKVDDPEDGGAEEYQREREGDAAVVDCVACSI